MLASLAVPATAQFTSSGVEFVEAVRTSNGDKVVELLTAKPTGLINARGDDGNTALIVALARRDEEWTEFLLGKGADPNLSGRGGDTPLIAAARAGYFDGVGWLLQLGAKVDTTNRSGETALILAVQQRQPMIVKVLLNAGADPDRTDSVAGYSARNYAARDPRAGEIVKLIESKKPKPAG
ncbi:MAG: ankyrin repeat domain-containing protein [Sphingomonas sp.]|nr:ankyrin repeat domain-containing protein [Sphingomonas sp.]